MRGMLVAIGMLATAARAAAPAEAFWVPALSIGAGYEDNRFLTSTTVTNTEGAAFLRIEPALGLRILTPGGWDLALNAWWGRTSYADSGLGFREENGARIEAWRTAPGFEGGVAVDAGSFADDALPADDQAWIALAPAAQWFLGNPAWALTLGGRLALTRYDNLVTTGGDDLSDTLLELRAGLKWFPSPDDALWIEAYGESDSAGEAALDYRGGGIAAGADRWLAPRLRASAWLRAGRREFPDSADPGSGLDARDDTPVSAGLTVIHRLRPWLELSLGATWRDTGSNRDESDLAAWSASAGVTVTDEIPIR